MLKTWVRIINADALQMEQGIANVWIIARIGWVITLIWQIWNVIVSEEWRVDHCYHEATAPWSSYGKVSSVILGALVGLTNQRYNAWVFLS